ncbi:AAA family ATPase [Gorillibacterium massiliense]|uniref:AAA family ATPase n=1 Tax=Gorillibacterium massiliense TaxID=1280390 RepID=UPI0004AF5826|nr:AAA family ATPase [Gorillibacterium massiliense]
MKKLILICGANGVGKSTASKALLAAMEKSAYIDSEYCCAIHPFEFTTETIALFKSNIAALMLNSFRSSSIDAVIFPYGFHGPRQQIFQGVLADLELHKIHYELCPILLECDVEENVRRMQNDGRETDRIERALKNTRHLYDAYDYPRINTTNMTVAETVGAMLSIIH